VTTRTPTGLDVARLAGVSKSAVSRAFSGGIVSDYARERIMEAARTLKYRPNRTARSLTTNRSNLIGVAITHLDNMFYPDVLERLSIRFAQSGFRLVLFITYGEADLDPVLDELLGYRLDGVILASSSLAARVAAECRDAGVPAIMFNNIDPMAATPGVTADNAGGAAMVARFLLAAGHRHIGLITGIADSSTNRERSGAFAEAVHQATGAAPLVECGDYSFAGAIRATRALLSRRDPPDALFCINDHMALAALQAAREMGREPGRNLSIVGFDDVPAASWPAFSLTTYAQPVDLLVETIATRILDEIEGRGMTAETVHLPGRLIARASSRWPTGVRPTGPGEGLWDA
jgi:DNA-binding LacI/PurR family transcriptional regulator